MVLWTRIDPHTGLSLEEVRRLFDSLLNESLTGLVSDSSLFRLRIICDDLISFLWTRVCLVSDISMTLLKSCLLGSYSASPQKIFELTDVRVRHTNSSHPTENLVP